MLEKLQQAVRQGLIRHIDYYFSRYLYEMDGREDETLALLAALSSAAVGEGHVCLQLSAVAGSSLGNIDGSGWQLRIPSFEYLVESLTASRVVGDVDAQAPLILDSSERLYLGRYWCFEQQVATALRTRARMFPIKIHEQEHLAASLQQLFPSSTGETNWQRVAAAVSLSRRFSVISGGPGTGKTHTVTAILALALEQAQGKRLNVALAAPTGKAAARLSESIRLAKPALHCEEELKAQIPEQAQTIHRLIGIRPGKAQPRHHADNPLHLDLLVVDEASMIDLPLMARLLQALPEDTRLLLLGDKDQLASVEAGSVFADITGATPGESYSEMLMDQLNALDAKPETLLMSEHEGVRDSVALLRKSYRFDSDAGIGALARAINCGDVVSAKTVLEQQAGVSIHSPTSAERNSVLTHQVADSYAQCLSQIGPREAMAQFDTFRVLCALRGGPAGVEHVNGAVEQNLRSRGLITTQKEHYKGRPIMVSRNDYNLGLFNGDIGILWPDDEVSGELRAWFLMPDNTMKRVLPSRLPEHETAYAMTVHKSQGSEFEKLLLILPDEYNELLTRELLYTAVTRARKEVEIWASTEIVERSIKTKLKRASGLADKLYSV